jgi:hypothetical protein
LAQKISANKIDVKDKFGIQVTKGIKDTIDLEKKNGDYTLKEAIKTELKQFTDYHTFIVLDSEESIPALSENSIPL